jgi:thymidylate synthase (FAD)
MEVKYPADLAVKHHHQKSLQLYNMMMDAGVCREQARGVLPQNLYTEYYGTVNLNNLLKFVDLRIHEGAQWEIQKVAEACLDIAEDLWPIAVKAYRSGKNENVSSNS